MDMTEGVDRSRRRFLGVAAVTLAAAHLGLYRAVNGRLGGPPDLAALDNAAAEAVRTMRISHGNN
jgi:hypothetical protein